MTDHDSNAGQLTRGDRFGGNGGDHHMSSFLDSMGEGRRESGGPGDFLSMLIDSIENGPRRHGHPASPRGDSLFGLDDDGPFGGAGLFGRPSRDPLDMLADIFGEDELDEILGKGEVRVMAMGPDGPHMLHSGEASISDIRRMKNGEDPLGLREMVQNMIDNPPSRNQRKLSLLSLIDKGVPLTLKLNMYAGHAGAEIARFLREPDANKDFAFVQHLAGVLAKAKTDDKEAFSNLQKRLKEYSIDLPGLIAKIQAFVDKPSVNTAKSVQMRLAIAAPVALALLDDVTDDLKSARESFAEKLRRTAKI